jgi:hypothetical protein
MFVSHLKQITKCIENLSFGEKKLNYAEKNFFLIKMGRKVKRSF